MHAIASIQQAAARNNVRRGERGCGGVGGGDVRVRFRRVFWLFVFVSVGQHAISDQPAKGAAVVVCGVRCVSFVICHLQF